MRKEHLVVGKKYRHPLFNFDLIFDGFFGDLRFIWKDEFKIIRVVNLFYYDLEQLTEVHEKIKVKCNVWIKVDSSEPEPDPDSKIDKIFGVYTDNAIYFEKPNPILCFNEVRKFKATFEEVDDE